MLNECTWRACNEHVQFVFGVSKNSLSVAQPLWEQFHLQEKHKLGDSIIVL